MSLKLISLGLHDPAARSQVLHKLEVLGECVTLSDSSFLLDSRVSTSRILTHLLSELDLENQVYVLELAPSWSAYGDANVNAFLDRRSSLGGL